MRVAIAAHNLMLVDASNTFENDLTAEIRGALLHASHSVSIIFMYMRVTPCRVCSRRQAVLYTSQVLAKPATLDS